MALSLYYDFTLDFSGTIYESQGMGLTHEPPPRVSWHFIQQKMYVQFSKHIWTVLLFINDHFPWVVGVV